MSTPATLEAPGVADMTDPIRVRGAGPPIQILRRPARRRERTRHATRPVSMSNDPHEFTWPRKCATVDNCRHTSNNRPARSIQPRRSGGCETPKFLRSMGVDRLLRNQRRETLNTCASTCGSPGHRATPVWNEYPQPNSPTRAPDLHPRQSAHHRRRRSRTPVASALNRERPADGPGGLR